MNGEIHDEKDYAELNRLGTKLGIPVPMMMLGISVENSDGTIVQHYNGRSRTWVRNFWNYLIGVVGGVTGTGATFGAGSLGISVGNNYCPSIDFRQSNQIPYLKGEGDTKGIIVGTGTGAESFETQDITTKIASGSSTGQLSYSSHTGPITVYDAATKKWTVTTVRQFTNSSGASISIKETSCIKKKSSPSEMAACDVWRPMPASASRPS